MTTAQPATYEKLRSALRLLGPEPSSAESLAAALGMRPIRNAANLVAQKGVPTELAKQLSDYVDGFYRVGEADLGAGTTVGMYLAPLIEWLPRSSDRERHRRKIAKALVEHQQQDARWITILLDPRGASDEAEFVMPRLRPGAGIGTIRAEVNLRAPNRYHAELLEELMVPEGASLKDLVARWNEAFSVERVTKRFYEEFRILRDRLIDALLECNSDNTVLKGHDRTKERDFDLQLYAFGTRQLGRLLFLWFLQQKRWLGNSVGDGNLNFLTDLFRAERQEPDRYYDDVLVPIFFDGLGLPRRDPVHKAVEERFGPIPFLGGGLFRAGADEFEATLFGLSEDGMQRARRVVLPDDLFDPAMDRPESVGRKGQAERTVLGLLRGYRFTTQESTPDDQSVDPDPELLGKVFENLYQADERHQTGAYYTPREIVHYMCRQTLDAYLKERTGISQKDIDWIRQEAIDWTISDMRLGPEVSKKVDHALKDVRILDPAVGSGAFLLAAIHEIVLLRRGIWQSENDRFLDRGSPEVADWKRHAATHCVYGVDINRMAIEICHLRLFLSIIVDLEVSDFRDIPALPNLDFRVVAGDSLIDRMGEKPFLQSLPAPEGLEFDFELGGKIEVLQKKVDRRREEFAGEGTQERDAKRLRDLSRKIRADQAEIARIQLDHEIEDARLNLKLLESPGVKKKPTKKRLQAAANHLAGLERLQQGLHEEAPYQKPFLWPVNFHEIFDQGGFDIVLANPPYVRMEQIDNVDESAYAVAFPDVVWTRADLLVYFYARSVQVLRDGGQLAFITSNKYMRAVYGENLRGFLPARLQVREVIDFGDLPLFTVAAYPAVLIGQKSLRPDAEASVDVTDLGYPVRRRLAAEGLAVNTDNVRLLLEELQDMLREVAVPDYPQLLLRRDGWVLEDPSLVRLFDRLMGQGTALERYVEGQIFYGVKTGLNEAFVIDEEKRTDLISADRRSAELLKPWLRGRDIKRWRTEPAGLYVIFCCRGTDICEYPAIHDHLLSFRDRLEQRATAHAHPWWELQQPQEGYYRQFDTAKIVWPDISRSPKFATDVGSYLANTAYGMPLRTPWLLPLLNSIVVEFLVCRITSSIRGGFLRLIDSTVAPLPIPEIASPIASGLEQLGRRLQGEEKEDTVYLLEEQLTELASEAYHLSSRARELIKEWHERRSLGVSADEESGHAEDA